MEARLKSENEQEVHDGIRLGTDVLEMEIKEANYVLSIGEREKRKAAGGRTVTYFEVPIPNAIFVPKWVFIWFSIDRCW